MNAEILSEAVRAYVQAGKRGCKMDEAIACALEIAYQDAAKVCRDLNAFDEDDPGESAAAAIEQRAK